MSRDLQESLTALLSGRRGHFRMESGFHSERWFNLDLLFADLPRLEPFVRALADQLAPARPDVICGPQTGGARLAELLGAALGRESCAAERHATPGASGLFPVQYRVPVAYRAGIRGKSVAIVDDAISAGSAVKGTYADLVACGARPVVIGALMVFGTEAARFAVGKGLSLVGVARTSFAMWPPADCPLCRSGVPVEAVSDATA